ncbi:MAG: hypothetical protein LBE59_07995 [Nevskiaceae bacterium]|nr:hypothetical protein [Nevskiaceae bacterium]
MHWLFIPGLLALSGAQIGLVQGVWKAADAIIVSQQGAIQGLTQQLLGDLQTQIGKMIEQNPSVTDVSLNDIVEVALAQAVFKITPDPQSSATINPTYVFALNWFARAVGSSKLHDALHEAIVTTVQDYTGADKKTVELALSTTMQQLADGNMFYDFSRTQLRRARSSLVKGVLALTFVLLLIPGLEISISKWRRW